MLKRYLYISFRISIAKIKKNNNILNVNNDLLQKLKLRISVNGLSKRVIIEF